MLGIGGRSPKIAFARAAKSGHLDSLGGVGSDKGHIRATGRERLSTVTSSPELTHASTEEKS